MFYHFNQNNSSGKFHVDEYVGHHVLVEAENIDQACSLAEDKAGIYFNGCYEEKDCYCCGDRWYRPYNDEAIGVLELEGFLAEQAKYHIGDEMTVYVYFLNDKKEIHQANIKEMRQKKRGL